MAAAEQLIKCLKDNQFYCMKILTLIFRNYKTFVVII